MSLSKLAKFVLRLNKLQFKRGDICVVRYDDKQMGFEESRHMNMQLNKHPALRGVFIISMPGHMSLEKLDERMMNEVGWFKGDPVPKNEGDVP